MNIDKQKQKKINNSKKQTWLYIYRNKQIFHSFTHLFLKAKKEQYCFFVVVIMNLFYFDTEYSNGNYYLGDIFEMALISERSGNMFHVLITIATPLDSYVKFLCHITDKDLQSKGISFKQAFDAMVSFINNETKEGEGPATIMAHSGYHSDFPLLLTNCIKNKCDSTSMINYCFIDTLTILRKEAEDTTRNTVFSIDTLAADDSKTRAPVRLSLKSLSEKDRLEKQNYIDNLHFKNYERINNIMLK